MSSDSRHLRPVAQFDPSYSPRGANVQPHTTFDTSFLGPARVCVPQTAFRCVQPLLQVAQTSAARQPADQGRLGSAVQGPGRSVLPSRYCSAPDGEAEYCGECVCVSVCLSAIISSELHVRSSLHFSYINSMAVAQSTAGGKELCYVFPVLWVTSYSLISQSCSTSPPD